MLGKVKMVEVDVKTGTIGTETLPGIIEQEGGFAYATTTFYPDEPMIPVDFIHQLTAYVRMHMFHQVSMCAIETFHGPVIGGQR